MKRGLKRYNEQESERRAAEVERRAPMKRGLKPAVEADLADLIPFVERRAPMKRGLKREIQAVSYTLIDDGRAGRRVLGIVP